MKKKDKKDLSAKIKELKQLIVSSTDAKHRGDLVDQLIRLQKDILHEPVELEVLCKDVKQQIDFGATKILKTKRGFLFVAKGGMSTFVESKMVGVCAMIDTLFETHEITNKDGMMYDALSNAIQTVFQTPIFASLGAEYLFEIATDITRVFSKYCEENYTNGEVVEETEEDIKANNDMEVDAKALENLVESPIPPIGE